MKILFTTPVLEYPPAGGPALRIANAIKALNKITELHILSRVDIYSIGGYDAEKYFKGICNQFNYTPSVDNNFFKKVLRHRFKTNISILNVLLNLPLKVISRIVNIDNRTNDAVFISNYVRKNHIDIIWFGFGNISFELMKKLKEELPKVKMVCDTDSVWSRFILRELDYLRDEIRRAEIEESGRKKEWEEKEWSKFMDVTTAVSEVDAEYYKSIATDVNKVKLFSNVVDFDMYINKPKPLPNFKNPCIYLAGSFWKDSPMEQAARWVIKDILPFVKQAIPDIHFFIIGNGSDKALVDIIDPNITITGKLDSVLPYLCNANVSIVPLKFESGTRFKILEAGACGIPIVSTTLGAEGILITNGLNIIIADEADIFAESIIKVINNKELSDTLSKNCKELIQKKYSIDTLVEEGEIILDYLMDKNSAKW